MRSVSKNHGTKPMANAGLAKKRGRPPKNRPSVIATMQTSDDPDIRFVRDLTVTDRTEVLSGADANFRYRWVEESRMGERKAQGYTEADDPGIVTHHDGNYWKPEGNDRKHQNKGGLKLMKIPVTLAAKRDAIKAEKADRALTAAENSLTGDMRRYGGEVLNDSDTAGVMGGE